MSAFAQGKKLLQGFKNKITEGFSDNRPEGFSGILGSANDQYNRSIDTIIASDDAKTQQVNTAYKANIKTYADDYKNLQTKTTFYLNDAENHNQMRKNYNMFVNKVANHDAVQGISQRGCTSLSEITSGGRNYVAKDNLFNTSYPSPFANYDDAEKACKLWAADSGKNTYAVAKSDSTTYNCYTGNNPSLANINQLTKPKKYYSVVGTPPGVLNGATQGGLLKGIVNNGVIGVWNGKFVDPSWNIFTMTKARLIKLYHNKPQYYTGDNANKGFATAITDNWWGNPDYWNNGGWGYDFWPDNHNAWWISSENYNTLDVMGYFYYLYENNSGGEIPIYIYMVSDDFGGTLKINGEVIKPIWNSGVQYGQLYTPTLARGKNVIEFKLVNTGGPGAFILYASKRQDYRNNVIFTSGPGWGYTTTPANDYKIITNTEVDITNPTGIVTINANLPTDYGKCDPLFGGGININTVTANYGLNCSNIAKPPLPLRYILLYANQGWLQMSQLAVNALENNDVVNVAPRGTVNASSDLIQYYFGRYGVYSTRTPIDGNLNPRPYPSVYHSFWPYWDWWRLDLGKEYDVTEIVYYNRTDCCNERANGMKLYMYNGEGGYAGHRTLTGALQQNFLVSSIDSN